MSSKGKEGGFEGSVVVRREGKVRMEEDADMLHDSRGLSTSMAII